MYRTAALAFYLVHTKGPPPATLSYLARSCHACFVAVVLSVVQPALAEEGRENSQSCREKTRSQQSDQKSGHYCHQSNLKGLNYISVWTWSRKPRSEAWLVRLKKILHIILYNIILIKMGLRILCRYIHVSIISMVYTSSNTTFYLVLDNTLYSIVRNC